MKNLKELQLIKPALVLRIGLGLIFIYAGLHMLQDPQNWVGFVPSWIETIINRQTFLYIHAIFELILGVLFLVGLWLPLISFMAFFDFFAILLFFGIDDTTFRDIGLLMMTLALFLISIEDKKKKRSLVETISIPNSHKK